MHKRATGVIACLSALTKGNSKDMTAHGEGYIKRFLDTGSIPVGSTKTKGHLIWCPFVLVGDIRIELVRASKCALILKNSVAVL